MTQIDLLVGPAIVAAVISGLVSLVLVQLNFRQQRRAERLRRKEKVRDFQIALKAEIDSDLLNMHVADRRQFLADVSAAYEADSDFFPVIPQLAPNVIFEAIVGEIHVLPSDVIGSVVRYARLRHTLALFVDDMRGETFRRLSRGRQLLMYSDYLAMLDRLEALASEGSFELGRSISLNSSGEGPSNRSPASAGDGAWRGSSSS